MWNIIWKLRWHKQTKILPVCSLCRINSCYFSRQHNFRIRGPPETIKDTPAAVQTFLQDFLPSLPKQRLEVDRAHRALQPPSSDGLPRDIIVKPYYYNVKKAMMKCSQDSPSLAMQGHKIQIFADLSPCTIQRRLTLNPYCWHFPRPSFTLQNKFYTFLSFAEGEHLLLKLGIIT